MTEVEVVVVIVVVVPREKTATTSCGASHYSFEDHHLIFGERACLVEADGVQSTGEGDAVRLCAVH